MNNNLSTNLVDWYTLNQRDLPWRKNNDPYRVWVSEIMLQQTQVDTVIPYFERFMETFRTVEQLATAPLENVYALWQGLGYYQRAKNLQKAAKEIMQNGFPNSYEELLNLSGIGPYTASAIASIAFNIPKGVVDGNVLRIISRLYDLEDNIALNKTKSKYQNIVDELIKDVNPSYFNQGLMDLGATICKPKNPLCTKCPLNIYCLAYKNNRQNLLPVNIKKIKSTEKNYLVALLQYKDRYFLYKEQEGKLLENLYKFPQYDVSSPHAFIDIFQQQYHVNIVLDHYISKIKHVFTHQVWHLNIYHGYFMEQPPFPLYNLIEINALAISTAHKKVLNEFLKTEDYHLT